MRPLPLVASGASGGLAGVILTVAREFLSGASGTSGQVLVPPEPEQLPFCGVDFSPVPLESVHVHWASFCLGLAAGFLLWPLLDLALLFRLLLTRSVRRVVRVPPSELYRVLE